jgi:NAD(P)-dependent dehydrogenase (short-subunit alcohol dehydrogenase family)
VAALADARVHAPRNRLNGERNPEVFTQLAWHHGCTPEEGMDAQVDNEPKPPFPRQHLSGTGAEAELEPRPRYQAARYKPAGKLAGKAALVTGADSGIGRAVALLYAKEGADVALAYHSHDEDAAETARAIDEAGRRHILIKGDVGDAAFCKQAVERTVLELGRIDILVSNAAYQKRTDFLELTEEQLLHTFRTNVFALFFLAQAAVPRLPAGSAIIVTGSETGLFGHGALPDYSATKGALHTLTKSLAQSLMARRIRVNCVAPGPVWTPLNPADDGASPEEVSHFGESTELGRPAQPEEIAPAFVFFASDADSSFVTGQVLPELGGVSG